MSDDFETSAAYLMLPSEAEQRIEALREQSMDKIGCASDWISYHHTIEKLNLQAHQSAQRKQDNFVVENLVTYQKFPTLIVNLLSCELWKSRVLPLLTCKDQDAASLRLYFILYHEAALVNLLEVAFFHEHVVETLDDDMLLEVVDYSMRKLTWLASLPRDAISTGTTFHKSGQELVTMMQSQTPAVELTRQQMEIEFRIAVQCVTIIRYISERLHMLPLSTVSRLLDKHDVLLTLAALIENPPWTHRELEEKDGSVKWKKFSQQKWAFVEPSDLLVLTSTEAQVWLAVYYLICTKQAREHYEVTQFRKDQLLRVRKYLNELLLDQLPLLADIQRYLDELSIMQVAQNAVGGKSSLVMEAVPYVRENLLRFGVQNGGFQKIAKVFDAESGHFTRGEDLKQLAELYQLDGVEELLDESDERRRARERQAMAGGGGGEVAEEEKEEVEEVRPTQVVLVFNNRGAKAEEMKDKNVKKPLIVEILDDQDQRQEDGKRKLSGLQDQVVVVCELDLSSQKIMETKSHRYYRYTLRAQQSPTKTQQLIHWDASVEATVAFGDATQIKLRCAKLELPQRTMASCKPVSTQREKLWKQIGSLQEDSRVVVQCQFMTHQHDARQEPSGNQTNHDTHHQQQAHGHDETMPYELGALFLSVPF